MALDVLLDTCAAARLYGRQSVIVGDHPLLLNALEMIPSVLTRAIPLFDNANHYVVPRRDTRGLESKAVAPSITSALQHIRYEDNALKRQLVNKRRG